MATQQQFNGTGSQTDFVINEFEFLKPGDVNIKVGTDVQESPSDYSIDGTTIKFTSAPASGTNNITAERVTNIATKAHTYEPGSSITAQSLNDNQNQALYSIEENAQNAVTTTTLAGNKSTITVSTDNVTWSINDNVIDNQHLKDNAVDTSEIKQNAVTSNEIAANAVGASELADNAVDTTAIADNAVTMAKLNSGALPTDITVASANIVNATIAEADIANSQITLAKLATAVANALTPVGTVIWYAGTTAPTGFLACDGATKSRTTYSALFSVISTTYGVGDGSSTFNLPSMKEDSFVRGSTSLAVGTKHAQEWKSFTLGSFEATGTAYSHEAFMGKSGSFSPAGASRLFTGHWSVNSGTVIALKWDGSDTKPKSIILLPCIKY